MRPGFVHREIAAVEIGAIQSLDRLLGLVGMFAPESFLGQLSGGILGFAEGLVFLGLGFLARRSEGRLWIGIALGLYVVDWLGGIALTIAFAEPGAPTPSPASGLWMRLIIILLMGRAFGAASKLREPPPIAAVAKTFE